MLGSWHATIRSDMMMYNHTQFISLKKQIENESPINILDEKYQLTISTWFSVFNIVS